MSMIAKSEGNSNIKRLEDGVYTAISSMLIDLGIQKSEKYGKSSRKFIIVWNIENEFIEVNGEQLPRVMSKEYTMSLGEKSNLRKDLQAWRGKQFTPEELEGFNLINILNKGCQLQILNTENNGKTYTNIVSIMALPKGMEINQLDHTVVFDTYDESTWNNYIQIPKWMQERIKQCENIAAQGLDIFIKEYEASLPNEEPNKEMDVPEDDLPF
ncbi:MAG: hypothetical protein IKL68_01985 [Clostridia bacterium]|nr:hypothetical protein [Clostridia bacterium]